MFILMFHNPPSWGVLPVFVDPVPTHEILSSSAYTPFNNWFVRPSVCSFNSQLYVKFVFREYMQSIMYLELLYPNRHTSGHCFCGKMRVVCRCGHTIPEYCSNGLHTRAAVPVFKGLPVLTAGLTWYTNQDQIGFTLIWKLPLKCPMITPIWNKTASLMSLDHNIGHAHKVGVIYTQHSGRIPTSKLLESGVLQVTGTKLAWRWELSLPVWV